MALMCECGGDLKMSNQTDNFYSIAECVDCGEEWQIAASQW